MSKLLENVEGEKAQRFGDTLNTLRKTTVTEENYEKFNDRVENIIDQVAEIIGSLQDDRADLLAKKERVKEQYGESNLKLLRNDGGTLAELGEEGVMGDLVTVERKLDDWKDYRGELERIGRIKTKEGFDQVDARSVKTQAYEKMDEVFEKKTDNLQNQQERFEESVTTDVSRFKDEVRTELREQRRALREERQQDWQLIKDVVERCLTVLQAFGEDVNDVQTAVNERTEADRLPVDRFAPERPADDTATVADADSSTADASEPVAYQFTEKGWTERNEELQRLVAELNVAELTQAEIADRTDLSVEELFDEESGVLVQLEDRFGDQYPELHEGG